jgi:hypothetical protein
MNADVHLIAYKQRITPVVRGKVTQVSAARLTEKRTDTPYYVALVHTLGEVAWVAPFATGGATAVVALATATPAKAACTTGVIIRGAALG